MSAAARDMGERDDDGLATPSEPPVVLEPLRVGVRHASLEHAPYRLLVGHYQGLPLSGAEAQLNRRSEGRLERLLLTQQYPQQLGEIAILDPVDDAPPQGAIIVGLGPSGELAPLQLRGIVARALLRIALNVLDHRLADPTPPAGGHKPLGISSVVVGSSGPTGLSVESSVQAVIDGAIAANARLTRLSVGEGGSSMLATDVVAFEALEFIERYEDRVDLIVSVLARMEQLGRRTGPGIRQPVAYDLQPSVGEGWSSARSPIDAANEVWRRLDIRVADRPTEPEVRELEFTSIGSLARAAQVLGVAEQGVLEPLIADAVTRDADPDVGGTLYELLVPHELKGELGAGEHLHLLVDKLTADYPWEVMRPRPDGEEQDVPLALRVGVLRQFRETEKLRFDIRRASGHNALVIGNPPASPAISLPGALNEATAVADQLSVAQWNVTRLIWDTDGRYVKEPRSTSGGPPPPAEAPRPVRALHELLNGDWRIVHIAAHGALAAGATSTGVLLGDLRLTANIFSSLSIVPDLVVVNACHLGRVLTGANKVAASVGRALLGLGVRAVVVAGWAVDDGAAQQFATRLYDDLLAGVDFGEAVRNARQAAWDAKPGSLTWGAYQCYGDPGFSLTTNLHAPDEARVHTVGELRRRLQRLRSRASDQGRSALTDGEPSAQAIRTELDQLCGQEHDMRVREGQRRGGKMRTPPEVLVDIADVWAELMDFRRAVFLYRAAIARGGSNVPIRSIEQLGNLASRWSQQLHRAGPADARRIELYARLAHSSLDAALALGRTGERLALVAGHHKRRATMTAGAERAAHLRAAVHHYRESKDVEDKAYQRRNWIQLACVAALLGVDIPAEDQWPGRAADGPQPSTSDTSTRRPDAAPDFWGRAGHGDELLTQQVVAAVSGESGDGSPPASRTSAAYCAAFRLRSSVRERDSVTSHLRDLLDLVPNGSTLANDLHEVLDALVTWNGADRLGAKPVSTHG